MKLLALIPAILALLLPVRALADDDTDTRVQALHTIAVSLPASYGERESADDRSARLAIVARAIVSSADVAVADGEWPGTSDELAALLLTKCWFESRLARWALPSCGADRMLQFVARLPVR